jgi:hypothetical protein
MVLCGSIGTPRQKKIVEDLFTKLQLLSYLASQNGLIVAI